MFPITMAFGTLIIALIVVLAINTTRTRFKTPRNPSPEQSEALRRAMRAHGNNVEHGVPVILLMMFYELQGGATNLLCGIGAVYLLTRLLYSVGYYQKPAGKLMQLGAGLTYLVELALLGLVGLKLIA